LKKRYPKQEFECGKCGLIGQLTILEQSEHHKKKCPGKKEEKNDRKKN
jgi:hypothetical protein